MNTRASTLYTALAIFAGVAVAVLATLLGNWQTRRGDAKEAIEAQWIAAEAAAPAVVSSRSDALSVAADLPRRVTLRGSLIGAATVFVDNRTLDGAAGFQVVAPLRLDDGSAVLVNRGWLPRDARDPARMPPLMTPGGTVTIEGLAVARVPHLLELAPNANWSLPGIWPNLEFADFERVARIDVAPLVVQQANDTADGLRRVWHRPAAGVEKHRGYALQWYGLAILSAGLTLYYGARALRRKSA